MCVYICVSMWNVPALKCVSLQRVVYVLVRLKKDDVLDERSNDKKST